MFVWQNAMYDLANTLWIHFSW